MASVEQTERPPELKTNKSLPGIRSVCALMIGLLVICFALQQIIIVHFAKPYDAYVGLSGYGMKTGHLWELLTYQLLHTGWVQFLINLAGLWFAGRWLEGQLGWKRFVVFYQGTIVAGGLLQGGVQGFGFLLPQTPSMDAFASLLIYQTGGQVGSSVGLLSLWTALCLLKRADGTSLFGKLGWPLYVCALIAGIILLFVQTNPELAHLAHLGGLISALLFVLRLNRKRTLTVP